MKAVERAAARAAYKERKVVAGIYLVRCDASGQSWVGQWPNIDTIQSRLWFMLRQGIHPNKDLLEAWRQYGEARFVFEVLEKLEEEKSSYVQAANLKERTSYWRGKLAAVSL